MIIEVNDKWRIAGTQDSWNVQYLRDSQKGSKKPRWRNITYHGTLQSAVNSLFERGCRMMDVKTSNEIQERVDQFKEEIKKALRVFDELGSLV